MEMMSTKMTRGGQTTVPKAIRDALGIGDTSRVYWTLEGGRVTLSATPVPPALVVESDAELDRRIQEAQNQVAQGKMRDAREVVASMRDKYGLA